jgi:DNA-binding transcriptional LysR family regulator
VKQRFRDISMEIDILRIEQAIDYLLLGRGGVVAISSRIDHSIIDFAPLATGRLVCIVPANGELATLDEISAADIAKHTRIGIDPNDPYGRVMTEVFRRENLSFKMVVRARFGTTMGSLVAAGLGTAIIDEFTVACGGVQGVKVLEIKAKTRFNTNAADRNDTPVSVYAEAYIEFLRDEMKAVNKSGHVAPPMNG